MTKLPPSNAPAPGFHCVGIHNLDGLAPTLAAIAPNADDVVLVLPASGSHVLASIDRLLEVARSFEESICVAASTVPYSSSEMASRMSDAVARATGWTPVSRGRGWRPSRSQPYPYGLLGQASALYQLGAECSGLPQTNDADHMANIVLEGRYPLVLDVAANVFHVLDGTGTDVVAVGETVHAGGEQPLVLIDPTGEGSALARIHRDMTDPGTGDLASLFRYEGVVDRRADVFMAAPDIVLTPFWTPAFCATIIRAAEAAALWTGPADWSGPVLETSLRAISPHVFGLVAEDLRVRIWPRLLGFWPQWANAELEDIVVVRHEAGDADTPVRLPGGAALNGSVHLNDGYQGGARLFPGQAWDDNDVAVGVLTVWPSDTSHPCQLDWVHLGVKYELILRW